MNKGIIFVIGSVLGAAIGSELTFIWTKKQFETKYDALRRKDYDDLKKHFEKKYEGKESVNVANEEMEKQPSQNASVTHQEARRAILGTEDDQMFDKDAKIDPGANRRSSEHVDYSSIKPGEDIDIPLFKRPDESHPYIITPREFESCTNPKVEMHYYLDGTLTDDLDEPVHKENYFPNIDIDSAFDDYSDEPDLLFIRDPKLKLDYEISKILVNYPETTGEWMED